MEIISGPIALLGSGETSLAGGRVFETIARQFPPPLRIAILETPAGVELNSQQVARRVGDYMPERLQNFNPRIDIIPARKLGTAWSPDNPEILQPLVSANIIFMGAGSPTYAVRQLKGSLAWDLVRARHRLGAALVFASAAVIAVGAFSLPVYEIYKVGEDIKQVPGLDLFADLNLSLSVVPHWNNTDGGDDVDTSRCFIGIERFKKWCDLLPPGHTTLGLDEHTGIVIDLARGLCTVSGVSSVTLLRACNPEIFPAGAEFPISELGNFRLPESSDDGISIRAQEFIKNSELAVEMDEAPAEVVHLAEARQQARFRQDWADADILRQKMAALGWQVRDTPEGQKIVRQP
jgi:hypothetical protein